MTRVPNADDATLTPLTALAGATVLDAAGEKAGIVVDSVLAAR